MKIVSIRLSEERAAAVEAAVATGGYASPDELVEAALDAFLTEGGGPSADALEADIDAFEARRQAGEKPVPVEQAFDEIVSDLRR
jgi:Arc/MetJ-type ribon-helix-helix transcriptional regulator